MHLAGCYDLSGVEPKRSAKVKFAAWAQACTWGTHRRRIELRALEVETQRERHLSHSAPRLFTMTRDIVFHWIGSAR